MNGLVDLEDVDREALQVAQRRIAGAEVVDRQAHAERFQLQQPGEIRLGVVHDRAFRELQNQPLRGEARFVERRSDVAG